MANNKNFKITKILFTVLIIVIIAEASLIYIYNPYREVKCPNCNSTNTEIWATDEPELEYKCLNCGAYFFESGYIFGYDEKINEEYKRKMDATKNNNSQN